MYTASQITILGKVLAIHQNGNVQCIVVVLNIISIIKTESKLMTITQKINKTTKICNRNRTLYIIICIKISQRNVLILFFRECMCKSRVLGMIYQTYTNIRKILVHDNGGGRVDFDIHVCFQVSHSEEKDFFPKSKKC